MDTRTRNAFAALILLVSAGISLASDLRQGPYSNFWSAGSTKYVVKVEGSAYKASIATGNANAPVFTQVGTGPVSDLQVVNACQLIYMSTLLTQQACEMAFDDTTNALRPTGVVVLPDVYLRVPGGEQRYRVELGLVPHPTASMALRVLSATPHSKRGDDPILFNPDTGKLSFTVFVPNEKDCIERYGAELQRDAKDPNVFVVTSLHFGSQYQWWGGGNDAVCPVLPSRKLI